MLLDERMSGGSGFFTQIGENIIPIEVKAKINNRARSFGVYVEHYKLSYAIRISQKNLGFENDMKSVPLYATFCIK